MFRLRNLRWPDDRDRLCAIDTSFTTEHVFRVISTATTFTLHPSIVSPPLYRVYPLVAEVDDLPNLDHILIAELDSQVTGMAALIHDTVDRRVILRHLYVHRPHRGRGIGRALMDAMVTRAQQYQARCLWLETQDVNYDAIQFYQRAGFQWCGLDISLDARDGSATDETAVFFMRRLEY